MKIEFDTNIDSENKSGKFSDIGALVKEAFETAPFPGDFGFRFIEDIALWDYYETLVFISEDKLHAQVCRWRKQEDYGQYLNDPVERFRLNGIFTPTLVREETILSEEEKEYFSGFLKKLLVESEAQILEPRGGGMMLDGANYVLQLFNEGKIQRLFRWDATIKTRGLMKQLMKLTEHIPKQFSQKNND
jgi:hypothetical protein